METQTPSQIAPFTPAPGSTVVYGLHGKCTIVAVENRFIGGETLPFFKMEVQKSTLSRSTRQEPAIWVPCSTAHEKGMRAVITTADVEEIQKIFSSREFYFPLDDSWSSLQPKLEAAVRKEGALGSAKVLSFLFVLKKKQVVPTPEVNRFSENVSRIFFREMSDLLQESAKSLEEKANRSMRYKLLPDH
jgi:RNA polymerase-interacting CarD/CdnL/TRCF family regulator